MRAVTCSTIMVLAHCHKRETFTRLKFLIQRRASDKEVKQTYKLHLIGSVISAQMHQSGKKNLKVSRTKKAYVALLWFCTADGPNIPALDQGKESNARRGGSGKHPGHDHSINKHFKGREKLLIWLGSLCFFSK